MRTSNYKHCKADKKTESVVVKGKNYKKARNIVIGAAVTAVIAVLVFPTRTLAPNVDAYEDSRIASYSVGDIGEFAGVISDNCVEAVTVPETQAVTKAEEKKSTKTATAAKTKSTKEAKADKTESKSTESKKTSDAAKTNSGESSSNSGYNYNESGSESESSYSDSSSGSYLVSISNPDTSYSPRSVSLSSYDRAKLERLVMGEAGTMGYTGCALVAQSIRDAMNRSNTSSIDQIISEYQYFGSTAIEPNQDVKNAVSYIFDQNGSAVQHRVLCFYTGSSSWHETQTFLVAIGSVRFFDLNV